MLIGELVWAVAVALVTATLVLASLAATRAITDSRLGSHGVIARGIAAR
jgi:hypothetical protein